MPQTPLFYFRLFKFLLFYYSCVNAYEPRLFIQDVLFDLDYGGLHTYKEINTIRFGTFFKTPEENICSLNNYTGCFDVMLSTIHPRTFVLDGRPEKCENESIDGDNATIPNNFCKTHPHRFNPDQSLSMRRGEPIPIINPLDGNEIGIRVQDYLQIDDNLNLYWQKFEIMNYRAASHPDYWGIKASGKNNLADGCLSLMTGELPEHDPNSFDNYFSKPIHRFVRDGLIGSMVTIDLTKPNNGKIWKNGEILFGHIIFGALSESWSCNGWHFLEEDEKLNGSTSPGATSSGAYWSFKMDSIEGIGNLTTEHPNAIIDTTTEIIGVPREHWDAIQNYFFDNKTIIKISSENDSLPKFNCADLKLNKIPAFRFSSNNLWYTIPPIDLVKKMDENECQLLIGKNAEQNDQCWHFGVPFLRSHCVAKDFSAYGSTRMWFSGGLPIVTIEDLPKSDANGMLPYNWIIWILSTIITFNFSLIHIFKFVN